MDRFSKEPGESVQIKASTKFNKEQGTLYCTNIRIVWVQLGKSEASLHFHLSDIKTQFVSTEQSVKALLRLSVKEHRDSTQTKDFLFEFIHGQDARKDLNTFRDRIAQVVRLVTPPATPAAKSLPTSTTSPTQKSATASNAAANAAAAAEAKKKVETYRGGTITQDEIKQRVLLLSANQELKQLFDQLVGGDVISEADFWETRKTMLKNDSIRSEKQQVGMPSMLLADVRPTTHSSNAVTYKLTPTIIKQIFIQHPSVERAYRENVPHKYSEQEFWKKYVHSKHFHRDRNPVPGNDDLFSKYDTNDDSVTKLLKRKLIDINPLVDISNDGDEDQTLDGYGVLLDANQNPEKLKQCLPLLRRFNRHSSLVLGSKDILYSSNDINNSSSVNVQATTSIEEKEKIIQEKQKIIKEHALFEDLEEPVDKSSLTKKLKIQDQRRYFEGYSQNELFKDSNEKNHLLEIFESNVNDFNIETLKSTNLLNSCQPVLDDIAQVSSSTERQTEYSLPESKFKTDFLLNFRKSNELLRHFWASAYTPGIGRPPTKQQIDKNNKLANEIINLFDRLEERKKKLTEENKHNQVSLISPIQDSLNRAIMKHQDITGGGIHH